MLYASQSLYAGGDFRFNLVGSGKISESVVSIGISDATVHGAFWSLSDKAVSVPDEYRLADKNETLSEPRWRLEAVESCAWVYVECFPHYHFKKGTE